MTKNAYGISIVKCCASCKYKSLTKRGRICSVEGRAVPSDYLCQEWQLAPHLDKAGRGDGKIKRRDYLEYALENMDSGSDSRQGFANIYEVE